MQTPPARIPFTKDAYEKLQLELDRITTYRDEVVIRLSAAREQGDLSENGAYKYAKMELGNISRQQRDLKYKIAFGYIAAAPAMGSIDFGAIITIKNTKKEMTFMLVSEHESDPAQNKLSTNSPIGKAVKGKKVGDKIKVETPNGLVEWKILKVL